MKKILCIAQSCCDMIFGGLPHLPGPGQEVYGDSFTIRPGGGANTPVNLGKLGVDVTFLTALGDDDAGRQILLELERSGVRTTGAVGNPGSRTAVSAVLSTPYDRSFASFGGTSGDFFTREQLRREVQKADIVHTYLGYAISWDLGALCREYGKELSLDVSWCDAQNTGQVWELLAQCHYLKLNDLEAGKITGLSDPVGALKRLAGVVRNSVVITLGERGSIGACGDRLLFQDIIEKGPFRDACGAGDAYAAGFLYGAAQDFSLAQCMELGAELSGLCVTWLGGNAQALNCTMLGKRFCTNRRK